MRKLLPLFITFYRADFICKIFLIILFILSYKFLIIISDNGVYFPNMLINDRYNEPRVFIDRQVQIKFKIKYYINPS